VEIRDCLDDATIAELLGRTLDQSRATSVEAHLDRCAECRRHVSDLVRAPLAAGSGTDAPAAPAARELVGARYAILRSLGRGGMGEVFLAFDPQLGRRIAIKLIRTRPEGEDSARARLRREAHAMARLAHPNVVTVFDLGIDGDRVFIAMELVEGETLASWATGRDTEEILSACVQAGRGVAAAHAIGLVHRDLTPRNVLIGVDGRARVADFGLVHIAGTTDDVPSAAPAPERPLVELTRTGAFVGTPAYAPPEAYRGVTLDARSDQWSLAATVWHVLYGHLPFAGSSFTEMSRAVTMGTLEAPRGKNPVPAHVERALRRALAGDREQRHASVDAFLAALTRTPLYRRNAVILGAAGLIAAGALGWAAARPEHSPACHVDDALWNGGHRAAMRKAFAASPRGFAIDQFQRVERTFDRYAEQWKAQSIAACSARDGADVRGMRERCLADRASRLTALRDELTKPLDDAALEAAVAAALALRSPAECTDAAVLARTTPPANPATAVRIAVLRGQLARVEALDALGRHDEALDEARRAVGGARAPELANQLPEALFALGDAEDSAGDSDAARKTLEEAGRVAAAVHDDRAVARAWLLLLYIVGSEQQRPDDALGMLPLVTAAVERAGDPAITARYDSIQGIVLETAGRLAEARARYEASLAALERQLGPDHLDVAKAQLNFSTLLFRLDEPDAAIALLTRGRTTLEAILGTEHPLVARALANHGHALADLRRWDEAEATLARARAILERAYSHDHVEVAWTIRDIAHMWFVRRDWSKARAHYEQALPVFERAMPDSGHLAGLYAYIGRSLVEEGQCEPAKPRLAQAIEIAAKTYGTDHILLAEPLLDLARCVAPSDANEATALVDRALALRGEHVHDIDVADRRFLAATVLAATPRHRARARELATAARDAYAKGGDEYRDDRARVDAWLAAH
jgi:tetratricopeptide (TPR) repeat protein